MERKALLEPFGITRYFTDGWGAYERHLEAEQHTVGKAHTQKIESKHINMRTRIKRLVRRTICFSKTERMHDLVIGLFINRYEFDRTAGVSSLSQKRALILWLRIRSFEVPQQPIEGLLNTRYGSSSAESRQGSGCCVSALASPSPGP